MEEIGLATLCLPSAPLKSSSTLETEVSLTRMELDCELLESRLPTDHTYLSILFMTLSQIPKSKVSQSVFIFLSHFLMPIASDSQFCLHSSTLPHCCSLGSGLKHQSSVCLGRTPHTPGSSLQLSPSLEITGVSFNRQISDHVGKLPTPLR